MVFPSANSRQKLLKMMDNIFVFQRENIDSVTNTRVGKRWYKPKLNCPKGSWGWMLIGKKWKFVVGLFFPSKCCRKSGIDSRLKPTKRSKASRLKPIKSGNTSYGNKLETFSRTQSGSVATLKWLQFGNPPPSCNKLGQTLRDCTSKNLNS